MDTTKYRIEIKAQYLDMHDSEYPIPVSENLSGIDRAEFDETVMNIFASAYICDFDCDNSKKNIASETSYVYYFKNASGTQVTVDFSAVDHPWNKEIACWKSKCKYYKDEKIRLDLPNYERRSSWKLVNVLVNGEECDNYDEALNHLEYVLKSL